MHVVIRSKLRLSARHFLECVRLTIPRRVLVAIHKRVGGAPKAFSTSLAFLSLGFHREFPEREDFRILSFAGLRHWAGSDRPRWVNVLPTAFRMRAYAWWAALVEADELVPELLERELATKRPTARSIQQAYLWSSTPMNAVGRFAIAGDCVRIGKAALDLHFGRRQGLWNESQAFQALGHVAQQSFLLQAIDLNLVDPHRVHLLQFSGRTTNSVYESLMVAELRSRGVQIDEIVPKFRTWQEPDSDWWWPLHAGGYVASLKAVNRIDHDWNTMSRDPVLKIPEDVLDRGKRTLSGLGVPNDAWIVGFHLRLPNGSLQANRDSSLSQIAAAARVVRAWGGVPVLVGTAADSTSNHLSSLFVDTRVLPREVREDVHMTVWATSRVFVGNSSGGTLPPHTFGVSTLFFDFFPLTNWRPGVNHLVMPQLVYQREPHIGFRLISLGESLSVVHSRSQALDERVLRSHGYQLKRCAEYEVARGVEDLLVRQQEGRPGPNGLDLFFDRALSRVGLPHGAPLAPSYRDSLPVAWFAA